MLQLLHTLEFIARHPLNRGRSAAALAKYACWQLGARLVPGPVLVPFAENARLLMGRSMTGATGNLYTGLQEFEEMAFVLHCLRAGDGFADAGANVGAYTVLAGAVCGARCYAFEPAAESFDALLANLAVNGIAGRCIALRVALGAADGEAAFTTGLGATNHVLGGDELARERARVAVRRLDGVLGGTPVTILKIDVEGYEREVLRGAVATLGRKELLAVIAEVNGECKRYGIADHEVFELLAGAGFAPMRYLPQERRLKRWSAVERRGNNVIFVRDTPEIESRLRQARAIRVAGKHV